MFVHRPHHTPTIDTPLTSVKLRDILGICPLAKPITSNLPLKAVALSACSDTSPPTPIDSNYEEFNTFNDLLAAKKVTSSETSIVIPRRNWTTGTTYDYYRHDYGHFVTGSTSSVQTANSGATTLFDSNFYVMTDDFNVYKCI